MEISYLMNRTLRFVGGFNQERENWKDKIRKEWQESKKLPRKKKKQKRKELLLDFRIVSYDPIKELTKG